MEFTYMSFHVLHKALYHKNTNMRFLWHHNNVKIDCISQLRYAQFKP